MSFIADLFEKYEYKNGSVVDKVRFTVQNWKFNYKSDPDFQVPPDMLYLIDAHW